MAKRAKKKNPDALKNQQRENMRFNQALDLEKSILDKKLNITVAIVIAIAMISVLLLPVFDINFSGSASDFFDGITSSDGSDPTMEISVSMSFFDFMFAKTKGYSNAFEYIAKVNSENDLTGEIIYNAFKTKVTQQDIDMFDSAYVVALVLSILLMIATFAFVVITGIVRSKKKDSALFLTGVIVFSALAIIQWIFFVIIGIASAGRGQLQPHVGSYLLFASAITLCAVYGLYRNKVKKIDGQRKPVESAKNAKEIKEKEIKEEK